VNIPYRTHWLGRTCLILVALALSAVSGCGRGTGRITGEVKRDGRPLPIGDIGFLSQEGDQQVRHADIIDGKYSIPAIQAGRAIVVVTTWQPQQRKGSTEPVVQATLIPNRFGIPEKSGLTYEIKAGPQTIDIDLPRQSDDPP
jgi:hypothetical protein